MIKNKAKEYPYDKSILNHGYCKIPYYQNNKKKKIEGTIVIKSLYCPKCKKYFINKNLIDEINKKVSTNRIIVKSVLEHKKETLKSSDIKNQQKEARSYSLSTEINYNNAKTNTGIYDNNLSEQSELAKLGYSTQLSRGKRWEILTNKALPGIGAKRTMEYIAWFIRLKKADTTRDYSRAINEWEYDLDKLKQKYEY